MLEEKWLRYQAVLLSKKEGISADDAYERISNDPAIGKADEMLTYEVCGASVRGRNLSDHLKKHERRAKIRWNQISLIQQQKQKAREIRRVTGRPKTTMVSGGLPSLGKKK